MARAYTVTEEMKSEITRRFLAGDVVDDIASDLGVSYSTVYTFVRREKLKRKPVVSRSPWRKPGGGIR